MGSCNLFVLTIRHTKKIRNLGAVSHYYCFILLAYTVLQTDRWVGTDEGTGITEGGGA